MGSQSFFCCARPSRKGTGIKPRNRLQTLQTSPKCQRETTAPNDDDAEKLTQSSIRDAIREQLREERHILTVQLRDGLAEVQQRIDTLEKTITTPINHRQTHTAGCQNRQDRGTSQQLGQPPGALTGQVPHSPVLSQHSPVLSQHKRIRWFLYAKPPGLL